MKKSVLADNPLEMMFTARARNVAVEPPEPAEKGTPSTVVAIDANAPRPTPHIHSLAPLKEPARELAAPAAAPAATLEASEGASMGAITASNRIGTLHKPYLRQKDGVETRQASVTLPVDLLLKVGHCAVDNRMKTSEIIKGALEEYLERRGY